MGLIDDWQTRWTVLLVCMLLPLGLVCATLWIQWRNWRTREWIETTGRVESARPVAREVKSTRVRTTGTHRNTEFVTDQDVPEISPR